jgi:hypothetical protein|tara:strand:+ start:240 stop:509 length:270 start_codon:yes stop_codon:yes gene_type:complete
MGDCHINIIADFSDDFGLELDLQGRTLLGAEGSKGGPGAEKLALVITKARRRGAVSSLRHLIQSRMLRYFFDHTFPITPESSIAAMIVT